MIGALAGVQGGVWVAHNSLMKTQLKPWPQFMSASSSKFLPPHCANSTRTSSCWKLHARPRVRLRTRVEKVL